MKTIDYRWNGGTLEFFDGDELILSVTDAKRPTIKFPSLWGADWNVCYGTTLYIIEAFSRIYTFALNDVGGFFLLPEHLAPHRFKMSINQSYLDRHLLLLL